MIQYSTLRNNWILNFVHCLRPQCQENLYDWITRRGEIYKRFYISAIHASYSGIRIFNSLPQSITNLKNEKTQFKVALKKFLNAHSFYSMDELFTCTDDMYYWLYGCVNVSYTVIFILFVCLWHVPHPIVLWLSRICGMYTCMYSVSCARQFWK